MLPRTKQPSSERSQTDASLRIERAWAERVVAERLAAIDGAADAVVSKARERADTVVAAERAKRDRTSDLPPSLQLTETLAHERALEDACLKGERESADLLLRVERAEQALHPLLAPEGTDEDLRSERARCDEALATRDELLGTVSHDLRNMLNSMVGFASLIETGALGTMASERIVLHAQRIQRAGARMNKLVGELVQIGRGEADTSAAPAAAEPEQGVAGQLTLGTTAVLDANEDLGIPPAAGVVP